MFQAAFFDSSNISSEVIALIRQLKTLSNVELHKRRIKFAVREMFKNIILLFFENSMISKISSIKNKIKAVKAELKHTQKSFLLDWMIDAFLITKVIKTLLTEIKNLRELRSRRTSEFDSSNSFVTQEISFVDEIVEQIDREQTISSKSLAEKSIFVETAFDKILSFENLSEKVDSFELFSLLETIDQEQEIDIIKRLQISFIEHFLSSETSSRILHETRVQSKSRIARVQAEMHSFQSSHFTNLRELFISHILISHTRVSFFASTVITSKDRLDKSLSEEYSANASSIATHHFNYQSLQRLVQRNFDFLISILSRSQFKLITNQLAESAFISSTTTESYSKHSNFESSKKKFNENVFTNHLKKKTHISIHNVEKRQFLRKFFSFLFNAIIWFSFSTISLFIFLRLVHLFCQINIIKQIVSRTKFESEFLKNSEVRRLCYSENFTRAWFINSQLDCHHVKYVYLERKCFTFINVQSNTAEHSKNNSVYVQSLRSERSKSSSSQNSRNNQRSNHQHCKERLLSSIRCEILRFTVEFVVWFRRRRSSKTRSIL